MTFSRFLHQFLMFLKILMCCTYISQLYSGRSGLPLDQILLTGSVPRSNVISFSPCFTFCPCFAKAQSLPLQLHGVNATIWISTPHLRFCYDADCMTVSKAGCNCSCSTVRIRGITFRNDGKSIPYHLLGKCGVFNFRGSESGFLLPEPPKPVLSAALPPAFSQHASVLLLPSQPLRCIQPDILLIDADQSKELVAFNAFS